MTAKELTDKLAAVEGEVTIHEGVLTLNGQKIDLKELDPSVAEYPPYRVIYTHACDPEDPECLYGAYPDIEKALSILNRLNQVNKHYHLFKVSLVRIV